MRLSFLKKTTGRRSPSRASRSNLSYYASGSNKPSRSPFAKTTAKPIKPRQRLKKAKNLAILAVILVALFYLTLLKPQPKIVLNSEIYHPASAYTAAAAKKLSSPLNRSKLTLNESALGRELKRQFPEIDSVTVLTSLTSQTPTIKINIAAPSFNYSSNNILYVVGANGVISGASSNLPSAAKLPTLIDQTGLPAAPGAQVLGTASIDFINTILAQCKKANVPVAALTLPPQAQELDLRLADTTYFVKFYLSGDATLQTGQFIAARNHFAAHNTSPSEYIDARVAGKIYFR